ncbi:MAG TPA: caspase family protein [Polyangiales bacterium]
MTSTAFANAGRRVAVLVGITNYSRGDNNGRLGDLPYTVNDLLAVRSALLGAGFKPEDIAIYIDSSEPLPDDADGNEIGFSELTRGDAVEVVRRIRDLAQEKASDAADTLVVYFTGHGASRGANRYFALRNSLFDWVDSFVSIDAVLAALGEVSAARKVIIGDMCATGLISAVNPGTVVTAQHVNADQMYSSKLGTVSRFDNVLHKSVYTHYLVEGLRNADRPPDGDADSEVTTYELNRYLKRRVPKHVVGSYAADRERRKLPPDLIARMESPDTQIPDFDMEGDVVLVETAGECADHDRRPDESEEDHKNRVDRCFARFAKPQRGEP